MEKGICIERGSLLARLATLDGVGGHVSSDQLGFFSQHFCAALFPLIEARVLKRSNANRGRLQARSTAVVFKFRYDVGISHMPICGHLSTLVNGLLSPSKMDSYP